MDQDPDQTRILWIQIQSIRIHITALNSVPKRSRLYCRNDKNIDMILTLKEFTLKLQSEVFGWIQRGEARRTHLQLAASVSSTCPGDIYRYGIYYLSICGVGALPSKRPGFYNEQTIYTTRLLTPAQYYTCTIPAFEIEIIKYLFSVSNDPFSPKKMDNS